MEVGAEENAVKKLMQNLNEGPLGPSMYQQFPNDTYVHEYAASTCKSTNPFATGSGCWGEDQCRGDNCKLILRLRNGKEQKREHIALGVNQIIPQNENVKLIEEKLLKKHSNKSLDAEIDRQTPSKKRSHESPDAETMSPVDENPQFQLHTKSWEKG